MSEDTDAVKCADCGMVVERGYTTNGLCPNCWDRWQARSEGEQ